MRGVLISGGTQPLGLRLAERLLGAGHGPVVVVGREDREEIELPPGAIYEQVDLTRARHVRRLLGRHTLEAVIHLAYHRDPGSPDAHRLNVDATRTLMRLSESHKIQRFLHRSTAEVYVHRNDQPDVLREDQALNLDPRAPPWIRHRVEADVTVSARMGLAPQMKIAVLRCAEILAPDMGSQLYDYLESRVCLRPMGFDPIVNLLSLPDATRAFELALVSTEEGPFNVPGADTLPLSRLIRRWGRDDLPVPGPLIGPAYALRRAIRHTAFRYGPNQWRFHFNGVLDGGRADRLLGYRPEHPMVWPTGRPIQGPG